MTQDVGTASTVATVANNVSDMAANLSGGPALPDTNAMLDNAVAGFEKAFSSLLNGLKAIPQIAGLADYQGLTPETPISLGDAQASFGAAMGIGEGTDAPAIWTQTSAKLSEVTSKIAENPEGFLRAYGLEGLSGDELAAKLKHTVFEIATQPEAHLQGSIPIDYTKRADISAPEAATADVSEAQPGAVAAPNNAAPAPQAAGSNVINFSAANFIGEKKKDDIVMTAEAPAANAPVTAAPEGETIHLKHEKSTAEALSAFINTIMDNVSSSPERVTIEQAQEMIVKAVNSDKFDMTFVEHGLKHYLHLFEESKANINDYSQAEQQQVVASAIHAKMRRVDFSLSPESALEIASKTTPQQIFDIMDFIQSVPNVEFYRSSKAMPEAVIAGGAQITPKDAAQEIAAQGKTSPLDRIKAEKEAQQSGVVLSM